jgi:flagellar hook assembly protein FlgD
MLIRRLVPTALLVALLLPAGASGGVRLVPREEPVHAVQARAVRPAPLAFTMVGIHWLGAGEVWFRTAAEPGRWSPWRPAQAENEDLPDLGSDEAARSADGWNIGNPYWTGEGHWIQYRAVGSVTRVRTFFIESRGAEAAAESVAEVESGPGPAMPAIIRRAQWGADESIVRDRPSYADRVRLAIVHHTAGTNSYSASQSAAIVRGIQRYHVLGNGWDDIGYNFLVDKYGRLFEGRGGGLAENVIGAHAQGFNTGSVGVAVLGTHESTAVPSTARATVRKLLAWRLDVAHVDPRSWLTFASYGNPRFPEGANVRLRAVSGHKDTGYTSCPGGSLYGGLGTIAAGAAALGLPKLYNPRVSGSVGGPVRFTGRLSGARAWLVEVKDAAGAVVARGTGSGKAVDWTWDSTAVPIGVYTYVMSSGAEVRPASGPVPGPPPLAVTRLRAVPSALTPNGDSSGEETRVSFWLTRRATLAVTVVNAGNGALVRTLLPEQERGRGTVSLLWDGRTAGGSIVPDARYRVHVSARSGSEQVSRSRLVVVDRTLGALALLPASFSPNGDGRSERLVLSFELTRPADVLVQIRRRGRSVRTILRGPLVAGGHGAVWDGQTTGGKRAGDGGYTAIVLATTSLGTRALTRPLRLDTARPQVRVLSLRVVGGVTRLRFRLSEPGLLRIWYGRRKWFDGDSLVRDRPAGEQAFWRRGSFGVVRLVPRDRAGNVGSAQVFRR